LRARRCGQRLPRCTIAATLRAGLSLPAQGDVLPLWSARRAPSRELSDHAGVNELSLCASAEIIMANLGDLLKGGGIVGGLAIGVGFALLAPVVKPLLRPLAKSVLKAGIVAYDQGRIALAELNEQAGDVMAEARAEMEEHGPMDHDESKAAHRRKLSEAAPKHAGRPS
jgi:hypothetical protein